ncbi:hypothetical protein [Chryseobacterium sp.]|uniref:hypothetical protein n=1 Tax=Chryseobacterium sp. TaxID=1871047 RepID=UPI0035B25FF4
MELNEFIKTVVLEIEKGVNSAQIEVNEHKTGTIINPTRDQALNGGGKGSMHDYKEAIKVEIEASILSSENTKGGINLQILSGNYSGSMENVSKVKFTIPILLPPHELPEGS